MCPVCNKGRRCVLEVEEKVDPYGCCEEKSGYVRLVRLESGPSSQEGTCASWLYG